MEGVVKVSLVTFKHPGVRSWVSHLVGRSSRGELTLPSQPPKESAVKARVVQCSLTQHLWGDRYSDPFPLTGSFAVGMAPVHPPLADLLCIFSFQTLTSKLLAPCFFGLLPSFL